MVGFIEDGEAQFASYLSQLCHSHRSNKDDLVSSTKCRKLRKQLIWRHLCEEPKATGW